MNKKGIGLVELLGAVVIFGLVISLSALFLSLLFKANDRIALNARANAEGTLVVETLEHMMQDLGPTTYSSCSPNDCLILEKEFAYVYDETLDDVVLETYSPADSLQIEIDKDDILWIDNAAYIFTDFTLVSPSSVTYSVNAGILSIVIDLYLESASGDIFNFIATYSFTIQSIPA